MIESESGRAWRWTHGLLTIYAIDESKLALYESDNDRAWISARDPVTLREWC